MIQQGRELLSPAGNSVCLHAAVSAGADGVYLGVQDFNARRGADNFTLDSLGEACDYAHLRGVSVYLTLNTVILPSETGPVLEVARQAYRRGVDAFIVQDIGVAAELARILPQARVHASTQMNIHTKAGIEAASELGIKRVTLARELCLAEIATLAKTAEGLGIEVEVFAHGALCVCYSGQCLMSSMIGGRSANRGLCAQACRLPYSLHNVALRKTLPAEGDHLLSPKDLCTIDLIPQLVDAGVSSFKIEGRMKSPEYVYTVTSVYRKALDESGPGAITDEDRSLLAGAFSRGFTTAYLEGERGNGIMSYERPNNRGAFIGRVIEAEGQAVQLTSNEELHKGDILEFWTSKGHFTHIVDGLEQQGPGLYRMDLSKRAGKGDRVFRVRNSEAVFTDDPLAPKVPVTGEASLIEGRPLRLSFATSGKGPSKEALSGRGIPGRGPAVPSKVTVEGEVVEAARTKPLETAEVEEHIGRFGNTPFSLESLEVDLGAGVGMGFSQLHKARAQALDELQESILSPYRERKLHRMEPREPLPPAPRRGCVVAAWAVNPACAQAAKRAGAERIYVSALYYPKGQGAIAGQVSSTAESSAGYPKQSIIALPPVAHDLIQGTPELKEGIDLQEYMKPGEPLLVENMGQLTQAVHAGALAELGPHVPALNPLALQVAACQGAKRVWLSPELTLSQIAEVGATSPVPLGLTLIGYQELMVTEHCLLMSQGPCDEDCTRCPRRKSPHYLQDRKGYQLPVITDCLGRSHLYNAVCLDVAHVAPELIRAGVSAFMVDTTCMTVEETTRAVKRALRARDIALRSGDTVSKADATTTGRLFKGIQ